MCNSDLPELVIITTGSATLRALRVLGAPSGAAFFLSRRKLESFLLSTFIRILDPSVPQEEPATMAKKKRKTLQLEAWCWYCE